MTNKSSNLEIVNFVRKTTEAITVISESTKELGRTTKAIQQTMEEHRVANQSAHDTMLGKMDGLLMMFKYVIAPLVGGILALVGIKMIFKL